MVKRPTIQTTVTASLTKSSQVDCNQMLPVRFASKFVSQYVGNLPFGKKNLN